MRYLISTIGLSLLLQSCCILTGDCEDDPIKPSVEDYPSFASNPETIHVSKAGLVEISGVAASHNQEGYIWLMEDSGRPARIELIDAQGKHQKTVIFNGSNRDWEDIAIGPGPTPNVPYLYIGEIGDNNATYSDYYIYRFPEPETGATQINQYETIHFRYPENKSYNSETLMVDPNTKDIYVITKDQLNVSVFVLPYPQNINGLNTAQHLGTIQYYGIVSGDISADGKEILLKSYSSIYYWKIKDGESIFKTLSRKHDVYCPYLIEPQGEAVAWSTTGNGYYTSSENPIGRETPPVYFYKKLP